MAGRFKNFMHKKSGIFTYLTYLETLLHNCEGKDVKLAKVGGLASFYIKTCKSTLTKSLVVKA